MVAVMQVRNVIEAAAMANFVRQMQYRKHCLSQLAETTGCNSGQDPGVRVVQSEVSQVAVQSVNRKSLSILIESMSLSFHASCIY